MREIKIRGKKADTGEWIYGNLFTPNKLIKGIYICPDSTFGDFMPGFEDGDNIEDYKNQGIALGHFFEVIPETVGQFTGLHDKNEVEIYEGSIVRFELDIKPIDETISHGYKEVYYDTELCEFGLRCSFMLFHKQFETDFEVIGNSFENPELL